MILFDTTPLVALCDRRDSRNAAARHHLALLASERFAVCDAVLVEACFHLPLAFERQRLRGLLEELDTAPVPEEVGAGFRHDVFEWLIKYSEHEPDWTDACLAILSGRHPEARVWTYDREFHSTWRRPDGSPIPLVTH